MPIADDEKGARATRINVAPDTGTEHIKKGGS